MVKLCSEKIEFLKNEIAVYYEALNDADKSEAAASIIGILDYILSTEDQPNE